MGVALALVAGAGLGLTGCQELYGGKPEKLATPQPKKKPKEAAEPEIAIKEVEDCQADFQADPSAVRQQTSQATQLISDGDTAIASSDKTADPVAQGNLLREGVDKYRNALIRDPYSAEATLKLALAYDRVYRKGCAIAMLKRLEKLSRNPRFARAANAAIESISDNTQWFKRWRKDANAAVGR